MTYNDVRAVTRAGRKKERGGWGVGEGEGEGGEKGIPSHPGVRAVDEAAATPD